MSEQHNSEGLLSGYRVLDLTDEKGLLCGKILGDFGADVIKIERPGGDPARNIGPFYKDISHPEKSLYWFATNANKRGITLNIETTDGREVLKKLVKTADFVIESFEPGYMASLGLGYSDLEKINPRVIMTSITPFGQTGPYAHYKGTDIVLWGMGGMQYMCGDADRPPVRVSVSQAFSHGGVQGAVGSMVALHYCQSTGEGQHVDVSIHDAMLLTLLDGAEVGDLYKRSPTREGPSSRRPRPQPYGELTYRYIWPCKDGFITWGHVVAGGAQAGAVTHSRNIVAVADKEGLADDYIRNYDWTKFDISYISQEEIDHQGEFFTRFFKTRTKGELMQLAVDKQLLLGPLNTVKDLLESPHLAARGFFVRVEHPELGDTITYPGAPVKANLRPWRIWRRAPLIGEHNEEVYVGELGFTRQQLAMLKAEGAI